MFESPYYFCYSLVNFKINRGQISNKVFQKIVKYSLKRFLITHPFFQNRAHRAQQTNMPPYRNTKDASKNWGFFLQFLQEHCGLTDRPIGRWKDVRLSSRLSG